jgi:hypothetical protein
MKKIFTLLVLFHFKSFVFGKELHTSKILSAKTTEDSLRQFLQNKNIPKEFELPILTALSHFPELKLIPINFVIREAYTPLSTRPAFNSMIKRKSRRVYIITISNKSIDTLSHLLYKNLTFREQVGIMGHELSHVVDFDRKNFFQSCGNAIGHISKRFVDKMEYKTDLICIQHGLGSYLETYSLHVRKTMHVRYWRGVDHVFEKDNHIERYMNPATIEKYMHESPGYADADRTTGKK